MRQATRAGQAARMAADMVKNIDQAGSDVQTTPPQIAPLRAVKDDNLFRISRYVSLDALDQSIKSPILLQFAGSVHDAGTLSGRPPLTYDGVGYRIHSLHPQMYQGVCIELVAVAYKP